ncbi:hypothetical protein BMS3Bbin09_00013 [bacterium BMS3Bbin09]|nr:hypothetical protein BMS3Bbin09_00013 [bacterium BMS3Bbin09]
MACSKRSLTLDAPTPTNISTKSEPLIEKKGTPASPAIAFASNVLPAPGGPTSKTPVGIFPPSFWNFWGSLRNSITSVTSSFASSIPATSLKVTFTPCSETSFALLLPNERALFPPPCICFIKNTQRTTRRIIGPKFKSRLIYHGVWSG